MSQHMISTRAKTITCRCGATVIEAIAEGLNARVDPTPLDRNREIAALLDDRRTYAIYAGELVHRTAGRIRGGLVGTSVHAEHRCPPRYRQTPLTGATP